MNTFEEWFLVPYVLRAVRVMGGGKFEKEKTAEDEYDVMLTSHSYSKQ